MLNKDFVKILQHLEEHELKIFDKYVKKNYAATSSASKIFSYLKSEHPSFLVQRMEKTFAFRKIFKQEPFDDNKLAKSLTELKKRFKEFLAVQKAKSNEYEQDKLLLQFYKKKQMTKRYFDFSNKISDNLSKRKEKNADYYLEQFYLKNDQYFHPEFRKIDKVEFKIDAVSQDLDLFFCLHKLYLGAEMRNREAMLTESPNMLFLDNILEKVEHKQLVQNELTDILKLIIDLHQNENEKTFKTLKELIFDNYELETPEKQFNFFRHLINFTSKKIMQGEIEYCQDAFDIYEFGLDKKIILANFFLTPTAFGNIIDIACKLGRLDWAKDFIANWKGSIQERIRPNIVNLGLARIAFEKDEHEEVIKILNNCEKFINTIASLRARLLLSRSFYLDRLDKPLTKSDKKFLSDFYAAFKIFITRKKLSNEHQESVLNFIKYLKRLIQINQKENIRAILNEIEECQYLFSKDWFLSEFKKKLADL